MGACRHARSALGQEPEPRRYGLTVDDWTCATCGFELYVPVEVQGLSVSHLGLHSDGRFPGRCLLVYRDHVEHMEALSPGDLAALWADAARVGDAVRRLVGADRINYAVLGNAVRHLHVHVIPRVAASEPLPTRPPWEDPRPLVEVGPQSAASLRTGLQRLLG